MDASTFRWINRFADRTGWAHPFFVGFAKYGIAVFAVLLVVAYLDGRRRNDLHAVAATVWAGAAAIVALGIAQLIGGAVDRARPYDAMTGVHVLISRSADFSFPSDHATAAGAVAAGLLFAGRRRWGVIAVACAIVMAFARVYVGVHYPGDVLAGLALGAAVAVAGQFFVVPLLRRLGERLTATALRPLVTAQPSPSNPDHRIDVRLAAQATLRWAWRTLRTVWCALRSRWRALSARAATDRTRSLRVGAVAVAAILVAVPFGLCAVEVLTHGPLTALDQQVVERVNGYNVGDRDAVDVARVVSALGSTVWLGLVVVTLVIIGIIQRRRGAALYVALTGIVGVALDQGLKLAIGRSRPVLDHSAAHALGHSFPSGHAMNSTVVYGALLVVAWPRMRTWAARALALTATTVLVTAIAASRVVLTVHYPSDVIAGVALGAAVVLLGAAMVAPSTIGPSPSARGGGFQTPPQRSPGVGAGGGSRSSVPAPQLQVRPTAS